MLALEAHRAVAHARVVERVVEAGAAVLTLARALALCAEEATLTHAGALALRREVGVGDAVVLTLTLVLAAITGESALTQAATRLVRVHPREALVLARALVLALVAVAARVAETFALLPIKQLAYIKNESSECK